MHLPRRSSQPTSSATALRALGDEEIMQLVRRGDAAAFEIVYERHAAPAF